MPLLFVLFVVLLILKLAGVWALSWWLVTMPLWIGFALFLAVLIIVAIFGGSVAGIVGLVSLRRKRPARRNVGGSAWGPWS